MYGGIILALMWNEDIIIKAIEKVEVGDDRIWLV